MVLGVAVAPSTGEKMRLGAEVEVEQERGESGEEVEVEKE